MASNNDGIEVRRPVVTAYLQGNAVKVDSVITAFGINSFPTVQIGFHDAEGEPVRKVAGPDVAQKVADQQRSMFTAQAPDSSVQIDDGNNGTLNFSGYISGPAYSLGVGNVGFSTSIVHAASAVSNLNTSIYTNKLGYFRDQSPIMKPDIGDGLLAILDELKKKQAPGLPDEESRAIFAQIDANNGPGYEIWKKICEESEVVWPELTPLLGYPEVRKNLQESIAGSYLNSYNDFFQTMNQFQAMFSMVYVPGLDADDMGRFIQADTTMKDGEDLEVKIRSINISAGPKSIIPLSYVVARGPKPDQHRDVKYGHIVARWPETAQSTGQVVEIGTPSWLPARLVAGRPTSATVGATVGDTLDLDAYETGVIDGEAELYETRFKEAGAVLKRWTRQHYVDFALASATAQLVTDLNVTVQPGVRYNVSSSNGALFAGFLVNVEHGISSKPQGLQAYTRLTFSHIEAGGWELPGK